MILRHYTRKDALPPIIQDGYLKGAKHPGLRDHNLVSLEEYKGNEYLLTGFLKDKGWNKEDVIPLFFDGERAMDYGVPLVETLLTKRENLIFVTDEEYEQIGKYYFVEGILPLQ